MRLSRLTKLTGVCTRDGLPFPTVADPDESAPAFSLDVSGYSVISRYTQRDVSTTTVPPTGILRKVISLHGD